jgi:hypothetical protein
MKILYTVLAVLATALVLCIALPSQAFADYNDDQSVKVEFIETDSDGCECDDINDCEVMLCFIEVAEDGATASPGVEQMDTNNLDDADFLFGGLIETLEYEAGRQTKWLDLDGAIVSSAPT